MIRRDSRADLPALLPPNVNSLGPLPFAPQEREELVAWLAGDGWPRGKMDIAMLEGYFVALLVWPVVLPPGAWLPPIWGHAGWKVPAKLGSQDAYGRFIERVVGFLRDLDRRLCASPASFSVTLPAQNPPQRCGQFVPAALWAQGFLKALQLGSVGLARRSDSSRSAVNRIARYATSTTLLNRTGVKKEITSAVLTLAAERTSHGPLGALSPSESLRMVRG